MQPVFAASSVARSKSGWAADSPSPDRRRARAWEPHFGSRQKQPYLINYMNHRQVSTITRRQFVSSMAALPGLLGVRKVLPGFRSQLDTPETTSDDLTQFVKIAIGTGGHGHTYPGATVPFGMVQLSPDT